MSDYTIITDFAAKDSLLPGNPAKAGKGTEITAELQAISTAIASKADSASPVLTTPQINDTSSDHQYIVAVNELAADRTVTLPLLTGNDEFVFKDHAVTLTNKTVNLTSNTLTGTTAEFNTALSDGNFATQAGTETITNKRITPRVGSTTSSATPTINTDNVDIYKLTAQTVDITSMTTNLSGTPTDGQVLIIQITGTAARAITWGASFEASTVALPTTTVTTAMLTVGFMYNSVTSKWRCMGSA